MPLDHFLEDGYVITRREMALIAAHEWIMILDTHLLLNKGWQDFDRTTLDFIEAFNKISNTDLTVAELDEALILL